MTGFLNSQTLSVSIRSSSVADPVKSSNVFMDIYARRSIKRDITRTSRMGLGTIRTLRDELRMRYRRATDTNVCMDFPEIKQVDFSVMP